MFVLLFCEYELFLLKRNHCAYKAVATRILFLDVRAECYLLPSLCLPPVINFHLQANRCFQWAIALEKDEGESTFVTVFNMAFVGHLASPLVLGAFQAYACPVFAILDSSCCFHLPDTRSVKLYPSSPLAFTVGGRVPLPQTPVPPPGRWSQPSAFSGTRVLHLPHPRLYRQSLLVTCHHFRRSYYVPSWDRKRDRGGGQWRRRERWANPPLSSSLLAKALQRAIPIPCVYTLFFSSPQDSTRPWHF